MHIDYGLCVSNDRVGNKKQTTTVHVVHPLEQVTLPVYCALLSAAPLRARCARFFTLCL